MLEIDGQLYIIDLDALMQWVSKTPNSEKNINTMTTITYPMVDDDEEDGEQVVQKEITESKNSMNESMNNVRYDFVRNLITTILATMTENISGMNPCSLDSFTIGQKIAFNTLLAANIIKKVEK